MSIKHGAEPVQWEFFGIFGRESASVTETD